MIKQIIFIIFFFASISCSISDPFNYSTPSSNQLKYTDISVLQIDSPVIFRLNIGQSNAAKFANIIAPPTFKRVKYWNKTQSDFIPGIRWNTLELQNKFPTAKIYVLDYTDGGSNLYNQWSVGGTIFNAMKIQLDKAINTLISRGINPDYFIVNWMQGEADCRNLTYSNNYIIRELELFDYLVENYNVNIIISYQVYKGLPLATFSYRETVRGHKLTNPNIKKVLISLPYQYYEADSIHLNKDGVKEYVRLMIEKL